MFGIMLHRLMQSLYVAESQVPVVMENGVVPYSIPAWPCEVYRVRRYEYLFLRRTLHTGRIVK